MLRCRVRGKESKEGDVRGCEAFRRKLIYTIPLEIVISFAVFLPE